MKRTTKKVWRGNQVNGRNGKRLKEFIRRPKRSLIVLAIPVVVGMIVQAMYNIVDTAFIGRVGSEAVAALTFSFPLFFLMFALNGGIGTGMGSRIARYYGAKNMRGAENAAMHGMLMTVIVSVVMAALGLIFIRPLFVLFGAGNSVLELSVSYMSIILYGMILLMVGIVIGDIFRAQGDTKTPMFIHGLAFGLNIVLDPIFIFVLDLGVVGAAIATVISFGAAALLAVYLLLTRSDIKMRPASFCCSGTMVGEILKVGAPQSLMFVMMSLLTILMNRILAGFGTDYVAAFGIVWRLDSFSLMIVIALAIAVLNMVGMFYGAKKYRLVKEVTLFAMKLGIAVTLAVGAVQFIFPWIFMRIFTPEPVLLGLGINLIRVSVFQLPFVAIMMVMSRAMQGMGFGMPSFVTMMIRTVLLSAPLAYLFVYVLGYGYLSIPASLVLGSAVSAVVAMAWFRLKVRHLLNGAS
ncbi:MATE family efflux transporter [Candidatus Woesearchaeota archaeon]|nr:MATE family efflux transporter [Candidatus Woesearchaeota archaeon]